MTVNMTMLRSERTVYANGIAPPSGSPKTMYMSPQKIASTLIASAMPTSSTRRSRSSSVSPEVAPMVAKGASGRAIICGRCYWA